MAKTLDLVGAWNKEEKQIFNAFIEIPQNSSIKYELDKESGLVFVDRFLYTAMSYPFNYGFVPGTLEQDGDPVDVIVVSDKTVQAGVVLPAHAIGMLMTKDEEGVDTKIIAVPTEKIDPIYGRYNSLDEMPSVIKERIKHFFEHYKELEPNKWVKVEEWKDAAAAVEYIKGGIAAYKG